MGELPGGRFATMTPCASRLQGLNEEAACDSLRGVAKTMRRGLARLQGRPFYPGAGLSF